MVAVILLLFLATLLPTTTHGLLFPGRCPVVPRSQRNFTISGQGRLIAMTPFSKSEETYFFREMQPLADQSCFIVITETTGRVILLYKTLSQSLLPHGQQRIEGNLSFDNSILLLESFLYDSPESPSKCHRKLNEEINIWSKGNTTILWSCRYIEKDLEHDFALIIWRNPVDDRKSFATHVRYAQEATRKYLGETIMLNTQWLHEEFECDNSSINRFPCPRQIGRRDDLKILALIIFILLSALAAIYKLMWTI